MRIIAGTLRGRRFDPPQNFDARPTTDFAKENIFNVLTNFIDYTTLHALDLFAGSGSISYELASRGCPNITTIEINKLHHHFILKTTTQLGLNNTIHPIQTNALKYIKTTTSTYNLIFADPPYALPEVDTLPDLILQTNILTPDGLLILEHSTPGRFNKHPNLTQTRTYGKVNFSLFKHNPQ